MNTIPANELKRRGVSILEQGIRLGPLHVIKNNIPVCVVLSEQAYEQLVNQQTSPAKLTLLYFLSKPATGSKTALEINDELKKMRDEWD